MDHDKVFTAVEDFYRSLREAHHTPPKKDGSEKELFKALARKELMVLYRMVFPSSSLPVVQKKLIDLQEEHSTIVTKLKAVEEERAVLLETRKGIVDELEQSNAINRLERKEGALKRERAGLQRTLEQLKKVRMLLDVYTRMYLIHRNHFVAAVEMSMELNGRVALVEKKRDRHELYKMSHTLFTHLSNVPLGPDVDPGDMDPAELAELMETVECGEDDEDDAEDTYMSPLVLEGYWVPRCPECLTHPQGDDSTKLEHFCVGAENDEDENFKGDIADWYNYVARRVQCKYCGELPVHLAGSPHIRHECIKRHRLIARTEREWVDENWPALAYPEFEHQEELWHDEGDDSDDEDDEGDHEENDPPFLSQMHPDQAGFTYGDVWDKAIQTACKICGKLPKYNDRERAHGDLTHACMHRSGEDYIDFEGDAEGWLQAVEDQPTITQEEEPEDSLGMKGKVPCCPVCGVGVKVVEEEAPTKKGDVPTSILMVHHHVELGKAGDRERAACVFDGPLGKWLEWVAEYKKKYRPDGSFILNADNMVGTVQVPEGQMYKDGPSNCVTDDRAEKVLLPGQRNPHVDGPNDFLPGTFEQSEGNMEETTPEEETQPNPHGPSLNDFGLPPDFPLDGGVLNLQGTETGRFASDQENQANTPRDEHQETAARIVAGTKDGPAEHHSEDDLLRAAELAYGCVKGSPKGRTKRSESMKHVFEHVYGPKPTPEQEQLLSQVDLDSIAGREPQPRILSERMYIRSEVLEAAGKALERLMHRAYKNLGVRVPHINAIKKAFPAEMERSLAEAFPTAFKVGVEPKVDKVVGNIVLHEVLQAAVAVKDISPGVATAIEKAFLDKVQARIDANKPHSKAEVRDYFDALAPEHLREGAMVRPQRGPFLGEESLKKRRRPVTSTDVGKDDSILPPRRHHRAKEPNPPGNNPRSASIFPPKRYREAMKATGKSPWWTGDEPALSQRVMDRIERTVAKLRRVLDASIAANELTKEAAKEIEGAFLLQLQAADEPERKKGRWAEPDGPLRTTKPVCEPFKHFQHYNIGDLVERVTKLEKDVYGTTPAHNLRSLVVGLYNVKVPAIQTRLRWLEQRSAAKLIEGFLRKRFPRLFW